MGIYDSVLKQTLESMSAHFLLVYCELSYEGWQ